MNNDTKKSLEELIDYIKNTEDYKQVLILKEELDNKLNLLNNNKLFVTYSYHLDKVNDMIKLVKDELNEYFYEITNIL